MSAPITQPGTALAGEPDPDDWDLDITVVESGPAAEALIRMTDDGCGSTCQSACFSTCP